LNFGAWIHHLKKVTENLILRIISNDSESQTAISGLGRRVGQLDAGQTENAEYQGTETNQSPHELDNNASASWVIEFENIKFS
ncbi:hypothetical protein BB560_006851, partial [Smittium megazygosporum]